MEILIDSSGSQQIRQSLVALQGYIISEALSLAEIPHRVMGFCTFGDYTVMRRYRDYDEPIEADKRILEFTVPPITGTDLRSAPPPTACRPAGKRIKS